MEELCNEHSLSEVESTGILSDTLETLPIQPIDPECACAKTGKNETTDLLLEDWSCKKVHVRDTQCLIRVMQRA